MAAKVSCYQMSKLTPTLYSLKAGRDTIVGYVRQWEGGAWEASDKRCHGTGLTAVAAFDAWLRETQAVERIQAKAKRKAKRKASGNSLYDKACRAAGGVQQELRLPAPVLAPLHDFGTIMFRPISWDYLPE